MMLISITSTNVCRRVVSSSTVASVASSSSSLSLLVGGRRSSVFPSASSSSSSPSFSFSSSLSTTTSTTGAGGGWCPSIPSAFVALQQSLENIPINNDEGQHQDRRSSNDDPATLRLRALSLYKQLLRAAQCMPTPNRTNYIITKTRNEYRRHSKLVDREEIEFQLRLADTNLDTVLVQAEHLSRLFSDPEYQNYN